MPFLCTYRIALGPRAGQKVLSLQSLPSRARQSDSDLRVNAHGFSLHAALRWRADQRKELEQLCRYISRPAIAPAIPLEYYLRLMGNYYNSWKKYNLPMPRRESVHRSGVSVPATARMTLPSAE